MTGLPATPNPEEPRWIGLTAAPELEGDAVHLWRIRLDLTIPPSLAGVLSSEEQQRAQRFYFDRDRTAFTVSHCALRLILASYLDTAPEELGLAASPTGKPFIAEPAGSNLSFNLSHSGEVAVLAVTRDRAVGVDLERLRPMPQADAIVRTRFPLELRGHYFAAPPAERETLFFRLWTCLESQLKATGQGLVGTPVPGAPTTSDSDGERNLHAYPFLPARGYIGALAVVNGEVRYRYFDWVPAG